jgi:bifunctional non-homologous end joining protein LigD
MVARPAAVLPAGHGEWSYELAWPGQRAFGSIDGGRLEMQSADGQDVSARYPELRSLGEQLAPRSCLLDGVVVAFTQTGRLSKEAWQARWSAGSGSRQARRIPVHYLVFDLLWVDGQDTQTLPYQQRRSRLEQLGIDGPHWQTPPTLPAPDLAAQASRDLHIAGVVAKRRNSRYQPDQRRADWLVVPTG